MAAEGGMKGSTFAVVLAAAALLAVAFGVWLNRPGDTGCDTLDKDPASGTEPVARVMTVEFISNTEADLRTVHRFVETELAKDPAHRPLAVSTVLVVDGAAVTDLKVDCLKRIVVLQGSEDDMAAYETASASTKRQFDEGFEQVRREQAGWLADAVVAELDALDIADPAALAVSTPATWKATEESVAALASKVGPEPAVSMLSPFLTTNGDCLDPTSLSDAETALASEVLADNVAALVAACVTTNAVPRLATGPASLVRYGNGDAVYAGAIVTGLCTHAVAAGCATEAPDPLPTPVLHLPT